MRYIQIGERHNHDRSDYVPVYDTKKERVTMVLADAKEVRQPTVNQIGGLKAVMREHYKKQLVFQRQKRLNQVPPETGVSVRVKEAALDTPRERRKIRCVKCNGTGRWKNPHEQRDQRRCESCLGAGSRTVEKDIAAPLVRIPVGDKGVVIGLRLRGPYHTSVQPRNYTATVRRGNSTEFQITLDKLERDEDINWQMIDSHADILAAAWANKQREIARRNQA